MESEQALAKPMMVTLNPSEKSRTYIYKSGCRHKLLDVIALGVENGWHRVQTGDGKLHVVYLISEKRGVAFDHCISIEIDCPSWTF